jgi:hypothetical protein
MIHTFLGERHLYGTNTADQARIFHHTLTDGMRSISVCFPPIYIEAKRTSLFKKVVFKALQAGLVLNFAISKRNELVYSETWQYQSERNVNI